MAAALSFQDVIFSQNGTTSPALDASIAGESVPRRVVDYHGYSFNVAWSGSPNGRLDLRLSNASVSGDKLVEPANWVVVPALSLTIGSGATPATSPSLVEMTFGRAGWVSLVWAPSGGSGTILVKFDGVRR